ncbi:bifunctional 3-deoxy-7-phosphoheptulonate synthase/chorismate mutase [Bacillus cereus group sp. N21]|uniref:bifunctional 3-deoxy-7-phosphoheptulonate synthase/chorismate mutase n=1 Tax=Bacillus cereus group sp. N21 TaxID=2794591 RepID=UPI0018F6A81C|nr:bifunctional 3-deoxy-7-phosphoheptulonate synthase/chorismate mutase [Bacillus cereus group sp. N21]MBJ8031292.1 bifunctional 3-deoxy-7-phosphoheptulonate synthase/chorismate mutase [Bacillus cereus group sp. N21]
MYMDKLNELRAVIEELDMQLVDILNKRSEVVKEIGKEKQRLNLDVDNVEREKNLIEKLITLNNGSYTNEMLKKIYAEIFKASRDIQKNKVEKIPLLVSRKHKLEDTIINIKGERIGDGYPHFVMGPCAVEDWAQVRAIAHEMSKKGLSLLRGGAYKPRTSPYDFQGLGIEGLKILKDVAQEFNMAVITELVSTQNIDEFLNYVDVIQIGARNMHNFELLKAVGQTNKPVLLKRGLSATIQEFIFAAEYILSEGNTNVILCERGIRTYETATRNTLDITAVPILKKETHLPVLVDVTHSTGRKDLLIPAAKAAIAIGADGVMAEVHPNPSVALSDSKQQMDFDEFSEFMNSMKSFISGEIFKKEKIKIK